MATQSEPTLPEEAGGYRLPDITHSKNDEGGAVQMHCPDPSAHKTKNTSLQDQASAAALYSTQPQKTTARNPLGSDGKLSSASAAASLKQAHAHDLPSFPIVGIDAKTSAGAAANLASANFKSPEYPKVHTSSAAAGKAALMAHDYKMAPLWQPEGSAAGSKAALLAHSRGPKLDLWQPQPHAHGMMAATIAHDKKGLGPHADWSSTEEGRKKALVAATGAVSDSERKRAQSIPVPPPIYPDQHNSARNALNAATVSHSASMKVKPTPTPAVTDSNRMGSGAMEAARIQHAKTSRNMYTSAPPVSIEVEEQRRQDALKASAISMAKKMYDVQQYHIDQAAGRTSASHASMGASAAHSQQGPISSEEKLKQEAMRYIGIQEAAQKLASERLAKIGPDEAAQYRSYYGYEKPTRNRLSIRRGRNRASSDPEEVDSDDEMQSRRIRKQMSQLNQNLARVDEKKRDQDRKSLYAAAERKVQAQMLGIDQKVFDETGKMSPAMMEEWDAKARAKASANSEQRMEHHGKVHIGHGKYMDQAEIDAIAQARMQPTLDEINEKTEIRLAEEEERRLEAEEKKRQERIERERAAEIKMEEKQSKAEEKRQMKAKSAEEKAAARQEKEAEKERRAEEKRLAKENRKSGGIEAGTLPAAGGAAIGATAIGTGAIDHQADGAGTAAVDHEASGAAAPIHGTPGVETADYTVPAETTANEVDDLYRDPTPAAAAAPARPSTAQEDISTPSSPTSPTSAKSSGGLKGFLNKIKRRSKHVGSSDTDKGFIGGANLRNSGTLSHHGSAPGSPVHAATPASVAAEHPLADHPVARPVANGERRHSDVSSLSAESVRGRRTDRPTTRGSDVSAEYEEARDHFNENLVPPPSFPANLTTRTSGSPLRDSKFHEVL